MCVQMDNVDNQSQRHHSDYDANGGCTTHAGTPRRTWPGIQACHLLWRASWPLTQLRHRCWSRGSVAGVVDALLPPRQRVVVLHGHLGKGRVGHANLVLGGPAPRRHPHDLLQDLVVVPHVRLAAVVLEVRVRLERQRRRRWLSDLAVSLLRAVIGKPLTSAVEDEHLDWTHRGQGALARLVRQQGVTLDHGLGLVWTGPVV